MYIGSVPKSNMTVSNSFPNLNYTFHSLSKVAYTCWWKSESQTQMLLISVAHQGRRPCCMLMETCYLNGAFLELDAS